MLRSIQCELNTLSNPDGSAMLMQGDTCVIAGVYGPVEAKIHKMQYDKASIEVVFTSSKGPSSINERFLEWYVKDTCESVIISTLHPGSKIAINIQEMQDSGGLLACAMNAACLALINSGISMKCTFAAVHCMIEKDSGEIFIDPDANQLKNARVTFTFGYDSVKKGLIFCNSSGPFSEEEMLSCLNSCKETSQRLFEYYRDIVKQYANLL